MPKAPAFFASVRIFRMVSPASSLLLHNNHQFQGHSWQNKRHKQQTMDSLLHQAAITIVLPNHFVQMYHSRNTEFVGTLQ